MSSKTLNLSVTQENFQTKGEGYLKSSPFFYKYITAVNLRCTGVFVKGGDNERDVSKFLSKWLTGSVKPYQFWRMDASGGLATVHEDNVHLTGDIKHLTTEAKFMTDVFSIECKTGYPKTSFWQHFSGAKFGIKEFWLQTLTDSEKSGKYPMLVYRKLGRKRIVGINSDVYQKLIFLLIDLNSIVIRWREIEDCFLFDFIDFFENIKPKDIKERLWQT